MMLKTELCGYLLLVRQASLQDKDDALREAKVDREWTLSVLYSCTPSINPFPSMLCNDDYV